MFKLVLLGKFMFVGQIIMVIINKMIGHQKDWVFVVLQMVG